MPTLGSQRGFWGPGAAHNQGLASCSAFTPGKSQAPPLAVCSGQGHVPRAPFLHPGAVQGAGDVVGTPLTPPPPRGAVTAAVLYLSWGASSPSRNKDLTNQPQRLAMDLLYFIIFYFFFWSKSRGGPASRSGCPYGGALGVPSGSCGSCQAFFRARQEDGRQISSLHGPGSCSLFSWGWTHPAGPLPGGRMLALPFHGGSVISTLQAQ